MCGDSDVKCEVKVIEIENGCQVHITGSKIKNTLKPENLKKCIEACCSGEAPFKGRKWKRLSFDKNLIIYKLTNTKQFMSAVISKKNSAKNELGDMLLGRAFKDTLSY